LFNPAGLLWAWAWISGHASAIAFFQQIREDFPTPEDIDDSPISAPSKRVLDIYPSYRKVIDGLAARAVGIETMQLQCPHFRAGMQRLEALDQVIYA
jgi:hypothetical protein